MMYNHRSDHSYATSKIYFLHYTNKTPFLDSLEKVQEPLEISALYRQIRPAIAARSKQLGLEQVPVLAPLTSSLDQGGELIFVPKSRSGG